MLDDTKKSDLNVIKKEYKKVADKFVTHKWIYRYIKDQRQKEMLERHYKNLTDDDTSYGQYRKSFAFISQFFGLPKQEIIIEWLEFQEAKNNEPERVALRYSKGLHKVQLPPDVRLIHVAPVDGITQLEPAFRSKTKGKFMYPSKRCFFTIGKAVNPFKAGLVTSKNPIKQAKQRVQTKTYKYTTKADKVGDIYIDPTYNTINDSCVMVITDKPISVMKFEDKMEQLFEKFKKVLPGKKKVDESYEELDFVEEHDSTNVSLEITDIKKHQSVIDLDEIFLDENDSSWYDSEAQELIESFGYDYEALDEGALKDFIQTIKNWKTSNDDHSHKVYKSNSVTDKEYEELKETIAILKNPEVKYGEYKKAFKKLCTFCHTIPTGTIITKYVLKKGEKDHNIIDVEYAENTKKIQLPEGIKLFHMSKVPGIGKLIPQFKGKSEMGYLYDKPRIYFTINKYMPRFLADYRKGEKVYKYEAQQDIKDVYVDPLVWNISQGAVYIETNSPIPVKEVDDNIVKDTAGKVKEKVTAPLKKDTKEEPEESKEETEE